MFLAPALDMVVGRGDDQKQWWDLILTNEIAVTHTEGLFNFFFLSKILVVFKAGFNPC